MSSLSSREIESLFLEARAEVMEWRDEFVQEFTQPDVDMMLIMFWSRLSPEVKAQLKQSQPQAYQDVERQVKEARERMTDGSQSL